MYLEIDGEIVDFDLDVLRELLKVLDRHLALIAQQAAKVADPDAFGHYDRAEYITGLGFVACQAYMASTYGFLRMDKGTALRKGPRHRKSNRCVVDVINHAANYWKHSAEWPLEKSEPRKENIIQALAELGVPADSDYPLSATLTELTHPEEPSFAPFLQALEAWREALNV